MPGSLDPDVSERLRSAIRRIAQRFPNPDRAQSEIAQIFKVKPSTISRFLAGGSGGSLSLAQRTAEYLNEPLESVLFGSAPKQPTRRLRELPGFDEAMADAVKRSEREHPGITREDLESAADIRATPEPAQVTGGLLIQLALARKSIAPPATGKAKRPKN